MKESTRKYIEDECEGVVISYCDRTTWIVRVYKAILRSEKLGNTIWSRGYAVVAEQDLPSNPLRGADIAMGRAYKAGLLGKDIGQVVSPEGQKTFKKAGFIYVPPKGQFPVYLGAAELNALALNKGKNPFNVYRRTPSEVRSGQPLFEALIIHPFGSEPEPTSRYSATTEEITARIQKAWADVTMPDPVRVVVVDGKGETYTFSFPGVESVTIQ